MSERLGELALPPEVVSVTRARHYLRETLLAHGVQECVDDAELAVSELVANAVKHACTPLLLAMSVDDDQLTVSVADGHRELAAQVQREPLAESGRGLRIVAAVASAWGLDQHDDGKTLWFRLPLRRGRSSAPVVQLRQHQQAPGVSRATRSSSG